MSTVNGQQILEVAIPENLRSQYQLGGNPIAAVINGVVWTGSHSGPTALDYTAGGSLLNQTALNFLKTQFDSSLAKPVARKGAARQL